jgi:hypothetical protein
MHIAHALGEAFGFGMVGRVAETVARTPSSWSHTRRVHSDVVYCAERCEQPTRVALRVVGVAVMHPQRAAAALIAGDMHLVARQRKHADCCAMHPPEQHLHRAAEQQPHPRLRRAARGTPSASVATGGRAGAGAALPTRPRLIVAPPSAACAECQAYSPHATSDAAASGS